jgi:hypothetical protein
MNELKVERHDQHSLQRWSRAKNNHEGEREQAKMAWTVLHELESVPI